VLNPWRYDFSAYHFAAHPLIHISQAGKDSDELLDQILDEFEGSTNSAGELKACLPKLLDTN